MDDSERHPLDEPAILDSDDSRSGIEFVDPKQLREHPKQKLLFNEPSESEIELLAQKLKQGSHKDFVQIFDDRTILSGQLMVKATVRAGIDTCPVLVRADLGESNSPRALLELIRQYKQNHSLDEMTLARCYWELRTAYLDGRERLSSDSVFLIQTALITEKSRESLEQLARLAELPRFVQDLISSKQLSKRKANRVRLLDSDSKKQLFQAISNGEPLKAILARFGITGQKHLKNRRTKKTRDPFSDPGHMAKLIENADLDHAIYRAYLTDELGLNPGQLPALGDALSTPALRQLNFRQDR